MAIHERSEAFHPLLDNDIVDVEILLLSDSFLQQRVSLIGVGRLDHVPSPIKDSLL